MTVVVAHYNESLEYWRPIQQHCVIYDKSNDVVFHFDHVKKLPNFGREGNSYLSYIIDQYPDFPDFVVFTQANISDHVRNPDEFKQRIIDLTEGNIETPPRYTPLNQMRCQQGFGTVKNFRDSSHSGLPIKEIYDILYETQPPGNAFRLNYCGLHMTSREALLFHSKKFYETMYDWMETHEPAAGYTYERLWMYIFDSEIKGRAEIEHAPTSERKIKVEEQPPTKEERKRPEHEDDEDSEPIKVTPKTCFFPPIASDANRDKSTERVAWVSNGRYTRRVTECLEEAEKTANPNRKKHS